MKRGLAILSALFILALSGAVFAGELVQDGSNWKYKYKEETSFCSFKIPKSAAKVEVLGVLDSY